MINKKIYFDCETTGTDPLENDIIQIAGMIEIDNKEVEQFNFNIQPINWNNIQEKALIVNNTTIDQLKTFSKPKDIYNEIIILFDKYIDKFDKNDKFIVCGYNVNFDIEFLNYFFKKNNNEFLFSYFGNKKDPFPVLNYLRTINKINIENLKLTTVCDYFKINIESAHDAMFDIKATKLVINRLDDILSIIK